MIEIINLNKTYETGNRALQNINIISGKNPALRPLCRGVRPNAQ